MEGAENRGGDRVKWSGPDGDRTAGGEIMDCNGMEWRGREGIGVERQEWIEAEGLGGEGKGAE